MKKSVIGWTDWHGELTEGYRPGFAAVLKEKSDSNRYSGVT